MHELAARGTDAREVECALWADAVFIILDRMEAAWRINPRGRPYPPKPSSALQVLRGVRRVHVKRLQVETVPLTLAVAVVEGLLREYAVRHGPEALIPQRKEPLSAAIIERLLHIIATQEGARVAHKVLRCGTLPWRSLAGLIHFMAQCGFRKAEVALAPGDEFGPMHLSMANVVWRIAAASPDGPDGKHTFIVCPTKEQLALLAEGDYAAVRPPPSKADQLGLHWAADPIYLPYHATAAINAARALAELEVMRGVASEARRSSPLFTDGSGKPFTHGSLDALLQGLLMLCGMSAEEARRYSWHSFRSFLACSLLAAGKDAATIQCLLRWKTAEALALYARINLGAYGVGGHIFDAMRADVESVRSTWSYRVPIYDADARVAAAHAARCPRCTTLPLASSQTSTMRRPSTERALLRTLGARCALRPGPRGGARRTHPATHGLLHRGVLMQPAHASEHARGQSGAPPLGRPRTLYRFAGAHTRYDEPPAAHSRARQGTYGRVRR